MKSLQCVVVIALFSLIPHVAYAYIEPTVAGYLFQIFFVVFNGLVVLLFLNPFKKITAFFKRLRIRKND